MYSPAKGISNLQTRCIIITGIKCRAIIEPVKPLAVWFYLKKTTRLNNYLVEMMFKLYCSKIKRHAMPEFFSALPGPKICAGQSS